MTNQPSSTLRSAMGARGPMRPSVIERAKDPRGAAARLLSYLLPFKVELAIVLTGVLVYTLLGLAGPYLIGVAIDRFIATKQAAGLVHIALLMLAAYIFYNVFQAVANWVMAGVAQRALKGLRRELFTHLQTLPLSFFDRNPAGELMSRLTNDIDAINQAVSQNVTSLIASLLTMAGILIAMFLLNLWLALTSVVVVPIILGFTVLIAGYTRRGFQGLQLHLGELNGVMEENISGQKVVRAFRRSDSVIAAFRRHNNNVFDSGVYANTYALMLMPVMNVLGNFFVIALAGVGGWLALQGLVTVGVIASFINYGMNFVNPVRQLSNLYNTIQAALAGAERIFQILDINSEVQDAPDAVALDNLQGDVRFEHVDFGYTPERRIIKDMTLQARCGEIVALVGPTGAGKTTITNLLTRFYEIDGGRITIDGIDIRDIKKADLRRHLGLVLQDTYLFSDTVMENIRFGRLDATDEEVVAAAKMADADHFIRQLPDGYETMLSERASNLSQGQRQLLSISRAILADPGILILDEATSSVDTRTEARIQKSLLRLMEGRTSFVIAHRLSTIRDANQVLVINDGQIIEQGTHQELLDRRGFYHHLYVSQFKGQEI
jgi:ATP-binding cassette subfamily B protein